MSLLSFTVFNRFYAISENKRLKTWWLQTNQKAENHYESYVVNINREKCFDGTCKLILGIHATYSWEGVCIYFNWYVLGTSFFLNWSYSYDVLQWHQIGYFKTFSTIWQVNWGLDFLPSNFLHSRLLWEIRLLASVKCVQSSAPPLF